MGNQEIKEAIKKYRETNENENNSSKILDAARAVLRGKIIAIHVYLKKQKWSLINNPIWYLKS